MATDFKSPITATITKNTPIVTRPQVARASKPLTMAAGVKPPRKRASAQNWPQELEGLKAPSYRFQNADNKDVLPIEADTGEKLSWAMREDGEMHFYKRVANPDGTFTTEEVSDVLYVAEDGSQWTEVNSLVDYDYITMEGTAEVLNKQYNAVQRFAKATGKGVIVRHDSETQDEKGNTLTMKKLFIRIR